MILWLFSIKIDYWKTWNKHLCFILFLLNSEWCIKLIWGIHNMKLLIILQQVKLSPCLGNNKIFELFLTFHPFVILNISRSLTSVFLCLFKKKKKSVCCRSLYNYDWIGLLLKTANVLKECSNQFASNKLYWNYSKLINKFTIYSHLGQLRMRGYQH